MIWNETNRRQTKASVTAFVLVTSASFFASVAHAQHGQGSHSVEPGHSGMSFHIEDGSTVPSESSPSQHSYHMDDHSSESDYLSMTETSEMEEVSAGCACGECKGVCKDPGHPRKPLRTMPGDRDKGDCPPLRYQIPDCERSGSPHCYHRWAKCSVTNKYSVGVVGGGAAFWRGRPRTTQEGTWGMDYDGLFGHVNNWLGYTRCRNQGGEGAYETVGGPEPFSFLHHE